MSEVDPSFEALIEALRTRPGARPEALARLHDALREEDIRAARRVLTPSLALAAGIALITLTSAFWLTYDRWTGDAVARSEAMAEALVPTQFVLHAAGARTVSLVGDFNDWDPYATPLTYAGDGVWSVVVTLNPGLVRYSFLVDGTEWRADPRGVPARNDLGRPTSVAFIGHLETS